VIDNLPAHKAAGIREAIEARGATLRYLPQYSPDLNPIEMPFSKLKASLRKAAERTIPRLRRRIGRIACNLTARESCNYFRHACSERRRLDSARRDPLEAGANARTDGAAVGRGGFPYLTGAESRECLRGDLGGPEHALGGSGLQTEPAC